MVTVLKGKRPVLLNLLKVTVKHGLSSNIVPVCLPLCRTIIIFQVGAVSGSDEGLTQMEFVDLK